MLRIPFAPNQESAAGLREVIKRTARSIGLNEFQVAMVVSHFFDSLADAVGRGEIVTIPTLGKFSPWAWKQKFGDQREFVVPRFIPARSFSKKVRLECLVSNACNRVAENYRKNNTNTSGMMTSARTFTAMKAFRERLVAQANRLGMSARAGDGTD